MRNSVLPIWVGRQPDQQVVFPIGRLDVEDSLNTSPIRPELHKTGRQAARLGFAWPLVQEGGGLPEDEGSQLGWGIL